MKHPAAYYLLLLYCTLMVRCAMPVACDALSHLFNEEQHIATVHAVYGSHHLQTEVGSTVSGTQSDKHNNAHQDEPTVVHTYTSVYTVAFVHDRLVATLFCSGSYPLHSVSLCCLAEPPKSC